MGRIPIPFHKLGPPAKAGKAKPPWPEHMTRHRREMAGFGAGIASLGERLGQKVTNQLVHSEFVEGKAQLQQKNNEFFESLIEDPDYENWSKRYEEESKKWQKEILSSVKTPNARNALSNWITDDAPRTAKAINERFKLKAQEDALRKLSDSIQSFIPSAGAIPEELELGIVNATAAAQGAVESGLLTKDQAEELVIFALMEDWPEVALEEIDASSLLPQRKIQLRSQAKAIIRNYKIEQKKVEQEVWDKTEGEAFNLWFDNKLTPEWVRDQFNLGNLSPPDRDAYLSILLRPKEVPLNWESYDKLQTMIEDYDAGKIDKAEVRQAITKAVGKDIPATIGRTLRDRLATKDKSDDPMNRASATRAMSILSEMKAADFFWPDGVKEDDVEGKRQNLLRYLELTKELEQWIRANPDATDEQINDKVDTLTQAIAEEKGRGYLERYWDWWRGSFFGVGYRAVTGYEVPREGEEDLTRMTEEELEAIIRGK